MTGVACPQSSGSDRSGYWPSRHLLGTSLWQSPFLAKEERRALEKAVTWSKQIDIHRDLISETDTADNLLVVASGWAYRYSCVSDGGRQLTALLVPGDIANLDTLLFDRLAYSVRTVTEVNIVALPRRRALALADEHPGIARTFTSLAMVENAIASKWMLSLGRRTAYARVAHLLCEIAVRLGIEGSNTISFPFPLRQEQIGDLLGLTLIHVNRMLQQLRAEGLIETCDRVLTIRNVAALRYSAGFDPAYLHMQQAIDATTRIRAEVA